MMNGYVSEMEDMMVTADAKQQTGGTAKKIKRAKTVKQRLANKARSETRRMIKLTDTLPQEVRASGFHYDEESNREVLEESRELGNQTDDESDFPAIQLPNPIVKQNSLEYRVIANKHPGGKPIVQIKGLVLDYDNTQSPFVKATYLENGNVTTGVLNAADKQSMDMIPKTSRKKVMRKRTAKRAMKK